jgi:hypothetical protein
MLLGDANTVLLSEERQAVIDLLLEAGKPLHYKAMAADVGKKEGTIKKLVWQMARDHQLIATGEGNYDISPTLLASIQSNASSVRGNQSNQRNQGNQSNQVTKDDGSDGSRRLLSAGSQVTDDQQTEISPVVTQLPWLPETDDSCLTDIDQDAAGVFGVESGDYLRRRPEVPPKMLDVDVALEMAAAPKPPVPLPDDRCADARGEQVDDTGEEMF